VLRPCNRPARLWARPGVHLAGAVSLGDDVRLFDGVRLVAAGDGKLRIGDGTWINRRTEIIAGVAVDIGAGCHISWEVLVLDSDHHHVVGRPVAASVTIGSHVWIGARAIILKGVTIGDGAVVGAGAVVNRDVPGGHLAAGKPGSRHPGGRVGVLTTRHGAASTLPPCRSSVILFAGG